MIRIYPSQFKGHIKAPASKAHAQRLLFASALTNTATLIKNVPECDDIDTTLQCLLDFGCTVEKHGETEIKIFPFVKTNPVPSAEFDFKQSGTTAHLAIPLAAAFGIRSDCRASGTLVKGGAGQITVYYLNPAKDEKMLSVSGRYTYKPTRSDTLFYAGYKDLSSEKLVKPRWPRSCSAPLPTGRPRCSWARSCWASRSPRSSAPGRDSTARTAPGTADSPS